MKAFNALQFLDRQGILTLSQEFSEKVKNAVPDTKQGGNAIHKP